jgi:MFS family permease
VGALVEIPIMWTFPRLSARFGAEPLLVTGGALFAVRGLLAALAPNGIVLVAIAPLEGAAFGLFFVGGVGYVAARAPSGLAGTAQGLFSATTGLATIIGTGAAGMIASWLSIPGLFAVAAAVSAVAAIVVAGAVRGAVPPSPAETGADSGFVPVAVHAPAASPPAAIEEVQPCAIG